MLKSLKRSLRKPLKVRSKRNTSNIRQKSKRKSSNKRSKRKSVRFAVIPEDLIKKYNNVEKLGDDVDLYINFELLKNGVDQTQLTKSYRKLAIEIHPDKNKEYRVLSTKLFQRIYSNYEKIRKMRPDDREKELQNILVEQEKLKEREKQMESKLKPLSEKLQLRKQREMERINKLTPEEKRQEISRLMRQIKTLREKKAEENSFFFSFFSDHKERMRSFERMEQDLLNDIDMLNGFSFDEVE